MARVGYTPVVGNVSGKAGQSVFSRTRNGATLRVRVIPTNPQTARQTAARAAMAAANAAYQGLSAANVEKWRAYALTLTKTNPTTGRTYHPSAISVFVALTTKFLQVTPGGTIPVTPPTADFAGDSIVLEAFVPDVTQIEVDGSGANGANITSEVVIQKLASANVQIQPKAWRTVGFHHYTTAGTFAYPAPNDIVSGDWVALGYRFVLTTTGEQTPVVFNSITQM